MRRLAALTGVLMSLTGCAGDPNATQAEAAYFRNCRDAKPDHPEASLVFGGSHYELQWQRRCDGSRARVFRASASRDEARRLVTLAMYPPAAEPRRTLDAYIARSQGSLVGEPRTFERGETGGRRKYIVELMLARESPTQLEYVLHGVGTTVGGRVVSVTFTQRFDASNDSALARLKDQQGRWVRALEREIEAFPNPSGGG